MEGEQNTSPGAIDTEHPSNATATGILVRSEDRKSPFSY